MSAEFEDLKEELDSAKGIAKRVYRILDVGTGWHLPKIAKRGIPIDHGTYFITPEPMIDAGIELLNEVKAKHTRLPFPGFTIAQPGQEKQTRNILKERIVEKLATENNVNIDVITSTSTVSLKGSIEQKTDLFITNGISPSMFTVPLMLLNGDDEVLITEPDYGPIRVAKMFGKLVRVPLKERKGVLDESRWYFDPDELESRITEKSKLFMFTNPNNPLGYVYSRSDLNAIARIAKKHDLFVFCNECYERQVLSEEFYKTLVFNSIAALPGMMERTFTVQGPTKGYETEGTMLIGWLFGPAKYLGVLKWLHFPVANKHFTSLGDHMVAAVMVSPFREEYIRQQITVYRHNMELLWKALNSFSWIECGKTMAGQFLFPDITKSGMDERSFGRFLVERDIGGGWGMVGTAHGRVYGTGHIRLAFCTPTTVLQEHIAKLKEALREYEVLYSDLILTE